jgi:hypothetical protein
MDALGVYLDRDDVLWTSTAIVLTIAYQVDQIYELHRILARLW